MSSHYRYNLEQLKSLLYEKHGNIVSIVTVSYINNIIDMYTKCVWNDVEFGDWDAMPRKVVVEGTSHPKRSKLKRKQTYCDRYGCDHYFQSKEFRESVTKTWLEKYGVEHVQQNKEVRRKTEQTNLKKYGVIAPYLTKEVLEKANKASHTSEAIEKRKQTCIDRFGVASPMHQQWVHEKQWTPDARVRRNTTNIKKYGYTNTWQRPNWHKSHPKINGVDAQRKRCETMKKNNSYAKSNPEDELYEILCNIFDKENVERQKIIYKWPIDFYVSTINTYIQYDGYWHGVGRTIEDVARYRTKHDVVIRRKMSIDIEQNEYFKEQNMKLVRLRAKKQTKITYDLVQHLLNESNDNDKIT